MPKLVFYSTTGKWSEHLLTFRTTIGRHPSQDLQLLDRMISKEHARVFLDHDGRYMLEDIGSRNGTTLNGELIHEPVALRDGDEISLGSHILRFIHTDEDAPPTDILTFAEDNDNFATYDNSNTPGGFMAELNECSKPIRHCMSDAHFLPETQITSETVLRQDYEKLRIAAELSAEASVVFDLDELLAIILDKAFQVFRADRAAILLRDDSGAMKCRIALDRNKHKITHFKLSETLLEEVIDERTAVLSGDALQDQRFSASHSIVVDNVRSTMCVPLMHENEVIGVINLDTQMLTGAFVEKDLQILTGFARQAAINIQHSRLIDEMRRKLTVRDNLRRIISPHLVDDVLNGKIILEKSGARHEATVLFVDIRGFTHMAEQNAPETIVSLLNDFCETMVECIFRHEGSLDKFVGDEVMAVWGVNVAKDNHASHAVACAVDMMEAIDELNEARQSIGLDGISIGIGIASGLMIAGYMGSTQAMSYTVIGDTVNLGARLCAAAQPGEILINAAARRACGRSACIPLPPIMVKGKQSPIDVFRVETLRTSGLRQAFANR